MDRHGAGAISDGSAPSDPRHEVHSLSFSFYGTTYSPSVGGLVSGIGSSSAASELPRFSLIGALLEPVNATFLLPAHRIITPRRLNQKKNLKNQSLDILTPIRHASDRVSLSSDSFFCLFVYLFFVCGFCTLHWDMILEWITLNGPGVAPSCLVLSTWCNPTSRRHSFLAVVSQCSRL